MRNSDLLSDLFATLRLGSDLYFRADLAGPYSVLVPPEGRLVRFHYVRRGTCWLRDPAGHLRVQLAEGDLAVLPNGGGHILADTADREPASLAAVLAAAPPGADGVLRYGKGTGRVELLCGFCRFDEAVAHPALAGLPPLLLLRPAELGGEPWTVAALRLLGLESELGGQGMQGILTRLLEVLFIQAVRRLQTEGGEDAPGYMAALADPQLSKALHALHAAPEADWTVSALARLAGMSRARFADRFTRQVGLPPMGYLTRWRLMMARRLLRESELSTEEIAARCGYASLPSFTRRYKEAFGIGPGTYRRQSRNPG